MITAETATANTRREVLPAATHRCPLSLPREGCQRTPTISASQLLVLLDDAALDFVIDEAIIPADSFGSITRDIDGLKGGGEIV